MPETAVGYAVRFEAYDVDTGHLVGAADDEPTMRAIARVAVVNCRIVEIFEVVGNERKLLDGYINATKFLFS